MIKEKTLLPELSPITTAIAFLETDMSSIIEKFIDWQKNLSAKNNNTIHAKSINGTLEEVLLSLCPLTTLERRRFVFVPTKSKWIAFFDNGHVGTDLTIPEVLSEELNIRCIYFSHSSRTEETLFNYYDSVGDRVGLVRSIAAIKESNWEFHIYGKALAFENEDNYNSKQIKKRFNLEILKDYLGQLEIDAFSENFYNADSGVLVYKTGPNFLNTKELTIAEAQSFFS